MRASVPTSDSDLSTATNRASIYLNVYDLTTLNNYMYWIGLGIFHSGIEVHGVEYAFGAHDYPTTGVFEVEPRNCPGFSFRRSILLGTTSMSPLEFRDFIDGISPHYNGDSYHLIAKNCNHFTDDICMRLTGRSMPGWVNRLANIGAFCNCLLPESLQVSAVRHTREYHSYEDGLEDMTGQEEDIYGDHDQHLLTAPNGDAQSLMRDQLRDAALKHMKDSV